MNPKKKCAVWISDHVVEDETKTHGKLMPKKRKEKNTKQLNSKSVKDKSIQQKSKKSDKKKENIAKHQKPTKN